MNERKRELELAPLRKADPSTWPKGVRPISIDEVDGIGVDSRGDLYWQGKRVETHTRLDLNWRQIVYAGVLVVFAGLSAAGAIVQGWASYNGWGLQGRMACRLSKVLKAVPCDRVDVLAHPQTCIRLPLIRRVE